MYYVFEWNTHQCWGTANLILTTQNVLLMFVLICSPHAKKALNQSHFQVIPCRILEFMEMWIGFTSGCFTYRCIFSLRFNMQLATKERRRVLSGPCFRRVWGGYNSVTSKTHLKPRKCDLRKSRQLSVFPALLSEEKWTNAKHFSLCFIISSTAQTSLLIHNWNVTDSGQQWKIVFSSTFWPPTSNGTNRVPSVLCGTVP